MVPSRIPNKRNRQETRTHQHFSLSTRMIGWYVTRLARGPDVTWDRKNNPHPWLHIDQETQLKLMTVKDNQGFTKTYSRDRL